MPAAMQNHPHTPRVRNGEPQPAPISANEPVSARRDLTSWWRTFSKRAVKKEEEQKGEALSLSYAFVEARDCSRQSSACRSVLDRAERYLDALAVSPLHSIVNSC